MMRIVRHNFIMKFIAFILALSAWGFTRLMDPVEEWQMIFDVGVRLSEGTSLVSRTPSEKTIMAYISGPVSRLERLQLSQPRVILDGRNMRAGETKNIYPRLERRYSGINVEFEPSSYEITVDTTARIEFEPQESTEGRLLPGYFIDSRIGLPATVTVQGASSLMHQVDKVIYTLNLSALVGSTELSVEFNAVDANGNVINNLSIIPPNAVIGIGLTPSQAMKTVPVAVDYRGTPATNYALTSSSVDPFLVEVAGPAEELANIGNVRTGPIDLTGKTSSFGQSVDLIPPSGNVILSISNVRVTIEIQQIDTSFTFENLAVEKRGARPDYSYELSTDAVDVTIRGGPGRVAEITAELIRPQVELGDLEPGTHEVRVSVALPAGVRNNRVNPSIITVTVTENNPGTGNDEAGTDNGSASGDG